MSSDATMNFFGAAHSMMGRLQGQIIGTFEKLLPLDVMMNLIFTFIGGILIFHFLEATYNAFTKGTALGILHNYFDYMRKRWLRVVFYGIFSMGSLFLVNGGGELMNHATGASWASRSTASGIGTFLSGWLGSNITEETTNPDGTTSVDVKHEAPVIRALNESIENVTTAVLALNSEDVYARIDAQIFQAFNQGKAEQNFVMVTYHQIMDAVEVATFLIPALKGVIEAMLMLINWWAFVWAQWTLCRALLVQSMFLQLSWHLGLYFLPLFILLAYFRSMQGFLVNLLKNYFAMMVAGYVMATLATALFSPEVWMGKQVSTGVYSGGIIQIAYAGVQPGTTLNLEPGFFPWMTATFIRQIGRGQIVWTFGACGLILGQVYDLVRGILDGAFRAHFQGGKSNSAAVFGGK